MNALLAGGSGLVGRELARQWSGAGTLHLLLRRRAGDWPAGRQLHVVDFAALPALPGADEAYCALGTTIKVAGSQAAFRAVDFDAVLAFAHAAKAAGVTRFAVVSALGASAKSANFYSRVKGEMEQALQALGFEALVIARPSLITGDRAALGQADRPGEGWALRLTRPIAPLIPRAWRPIPAECIARAMLGAVCDGRSGVRVLNSAAMQSLP